MEEDDYENHDKNLFRKILAGDYEFDSPYWDDISQAGEEAPSFWVGGRGGVGSLLSALRAGSAPGLQLIQHSRQRGGAPALSLSLALSPAKDLVTRLMEVEQDQRITAEEAISHEW